MECEHRVFPDYALSVVRLRGDVTSACVLEHLSRLTLDALWHPTFSTLWDARGIQRLTIAPADLDLLTECSPQNGEQSSGRVAIVVARQIEYQLLSLLLIQRNAATRIHKVFCELPSALGWLGIPETPKLTW